MSIERGTTLYIGPPGTGKTYCLSELVKECIDYGRHPLLCSLTRTAAAEIAGRNSSLSKETVGTLHSHAYRALDRPELVSKHLADWNEEEPSLQLRAGMDLDDPLSDNRGSMNTGDQLIQQYDALRAKMIDRSLWPTDVVFFAKRWEAWKKKTGLVDFTDLIEQAIDKRPRGVDVIMVDEAQDHSRLELTLLKRWAQEAGSLVIVGDPWQALYSWRGAHPEMFDSEKVSSDRRNVLDQSYRVPRQVHAKAMEWIRRLSTYSDIAYKPTEFEGMVRQIPASYADPSPILNVIRETTEIGQTVMIAASCGYMLNSVVAMLRDNGIPFCNPWRRKNGRWNPMSASRGIPIARRIHAFLSPLSGETFSFGHNTSGWTASSLCMWVDSINAHGILLPGAKQEISQRGKAEFADKDSVSREEIDSLFSMDAAAFLHGIADGVIDKNTAANWMEERLTEASKKTAGFPLGIVKAGTVDSLVEQPRVYVGTIHSFKGSEADAVIVFPDLSVRGMEEWMFPGWAQDNVIRMFYVAMTRARHSLYTCWPSSRKAVDL